MRTFSEDIIRFLNGEPIRAKSRSSWTKFWIRVSGKPIEAICIAILITFAASHLPFYVAKRIWPHIPEHLSEKIEPLIPINAQGNLLYGLCTLILGLLLVASSPKRNGLTLGSLKAHGPAVFLISVYIVILTYCFNHLTERQFPPVGVSIYSSLAQSVGLTFVFSGFIYRIIDEAIPNFIHTKIKIRWAVPLHAFFFACWQFGNEGYLPGWYILMGCACGFIAWILLGLTRQWTGSLVYSWLTYVGIICVFYLI